jgi:hypothetical protein
MDEHIKMAASAGLLVSVELTYLQSSVTFLNHNSPSLLIKLRA